MFVGIGANSPSGGYNIEQSLRVRGSAGSYLTRTFGSGGNQKTWTWSAWIKRGSLNDLQTPFYAGNSVTTERGGLFFQSSTDTLQFSGSISGTTTTGLLVETAAAFRDPSSWYHVILALDTTQATGSDRFKMYVNGVQQTLTTTTTPSQNTDLVFNKSGIIHSTRHPSTDYRFKGYIAENHFIDGQQLTAEDFGEYNTDGVWQPIEYTGTYGTTGYYLNFSDSTSTTTLLYDQSPNSNHWTPSGISLTAGSTYDLMSDVPTLTDEDTSNFATWNPLHFDGLQTGTVIYTNASFSDGNLKATCTTTNSLLTVRSTIREASIDKTYWEGTFSGQTGAYANYVYIGIVGSGGYHLYTSDGNYTGTNGTYSYGATYTSGDTIGVATDLSGGTIEFFKNGTSQGSISIANTNMSAQVRIWNNTAQAHIELNCGQRPFAYTPPTGFLKLNTYNLPDSSITDGSQYFAPLTYTGDGNSTHAITGLDFSPDLVWIKDRSFTWWNYLMDTNRGAGVALWSNAADAEAAFGLTSIDSNGFTTTSDAGTNQSTHPYISWNWRGSDSTAVSNTDGTITSTVSANTTSGFSVVTYTGTAAVATVGHGLGVAPSMIITKNRDTTTDWWVYHAALGNTKYMVLNTTAAAVTSSTAWNNTSPTSTVFTLGGAGNPSNANQDVAYCFAEVEGFSKFGSYTGNGSTNGTFVYLGFRPAYIMIKRNAVESWVIADNQRNTYNQVTNYLLADASNAESSGIAYDFVSNGIKFRSNSQNESGATYYYMAFAENPFKNSLAR